MILGDGLFEAIYEAKKSKKYGKEWDRQGLILLISRGGVYNGFYKLLFI